MAPTPTRHAPSVAGVAAAERRATYRALATDASYEPRPALRRCEVCDELLPQSSTRCDTCGAMPDDPFIRRARSGRGS